MASNRVVVFISTFGYIGDLPIAPGTAASVAGLLLAVGMQGNWDLYVAITTIITMIGFLVTGKMEKIRGEKDPGCVVIDEVSGMLIAFFMLPITWPVMITSFFLFRAFDMFKIYPVNKFEKLHGSWGIMLDDIVAGLYTNIIMHLAIHFTHIF